MAVLKSLVLILALTIAFPTTLLATDFVWDGGGDGSTWSDANNWDLDAGYPDDENDTATFSSGMDTVSTGAALEIGGLTLGGTFAGTLTLSGKLKLDSEGDEAGNFTHSSGTFNCSSFLLVVEGAFNQSGGTFTASTGSVILSSTLDQTFTAAAGTSFNNLAINDGLILHLKLDETASGTAVDSSGYGSDGADAGTPTVSTDVAPVNFHNPRSIAFDGSNDRYNFLTGFTDDFNPLKGSVSAWVYRSFDDNPSNQQTIMRIRVSSSHNIFLGFDSGGGGGWKFKYKAAGTTEETVFAKSLIPQSTWAHICYTWDVVNDVTKIYLNGVLQDTNLCPTGWAGALAVAQIGANNNGSNSNYWTGNLDDVRVYNRVLTVAEISALALGNNTESGTTTLAQNIDVNGDLIISSGKLDVSASSYSIEVAGDWNNAAGEFNARAGTVNFDATSGSHSIYGNGQAFYDVDLDDSAGTATWTLQEAIDIDDDLIINDGTLDANGQTIELGGDFNYVGGTFTHNNNSVTFDGSGTSLITGSNTFYNVSCITAGKQITFTAGTTQTVANKIELTGTSSQKVTLRSSSASSKWDITFSGSAQEVSFVDVQDSDANTNTITVTGGTDTGNNNANWIFSGRTLYWVTGGSGSWSGSNNWSLSSGGSSGEAKPGASDTAVFDSNSGSGTCNVDESINAFGISIASGASITIAQGANKFIIGDGGYTQAAGTFTGGTGDFDVDGNFTLSGGTYTATSGRTQVAANFINNGGTFAHNDGRVEFDGNTSLTGTNATTFYDVTISGTLVGHPTSMSVNRAWELTGTFTNNSGEVNLTSTSNAVLTGDTTFRDFTCTVAAKQIAFTAGSTQTVLGTFGLTGTFSNKIVLISTAAASKWDLDIPNGDQTVSNVDVMDSDANFKTVTVTNGTDSGNNNANWIFSSTNRYWVTGGSGSWNNTNNWSTTSGGASGASVPGSAQLAVFDGNSGAGTATVNTTVDVLGITLTSATSITVSQGANSITCGSSGFEQEAGTFTGGSADIDLGGPLNLTGGTFTSTSGTLTLEDNLSIGAGVTFSANGGNIELDALSGTVNVTTNGKTFNDLTLNDGGGSAAFVLQDAIDIDGFLYITGGTLNTNGKNLFLERDWNNQDAYTASSSAVTFNGSVQQTVVGSTTFAMFHYNGSAGVSFDAAPTFSSGLIVESGAVTFGAVTVSFANNAAIRVGRGAASPAVISLDGTTFTSTPTPGTDRYAFSIEPGGDITVKQSSRIDSLADSGLVFKAGSRLGSNTTGSDGFSNFSFVTIDNIAASGVGIDFSALTGGDDDSFPNSLREIRFNGSTSGTNVKAGATTPTMKFHVQTGDFGTVDGTGEANDDDASSRISWHASATYAAFSSLEAVGSGDDVRIGWKTALEVSNAGFNVYRSADRHGAFVRINDVLIAPVSGPTSLAGGTYHFDDGVPGRGEIFFYKVEDVDLDGTRTFHGPVCVDWDVDGMADDWERSNGFDNLDADDANGDADGDGLSNLDESRFGQNPNVADTDGDGVPDGQESLTVWEGPVVPGVAAGGSGVRILGRDAMGLTVELDIPDVEVRTVRRPFTGFAGEGELLPWHHRWRPRQLTTLAFDGITSEYETMTGRARLPVKRVLLNVPEGKVPVVRILDRMDGPSRILSHPVEPVPRVVDRPTLVTKLRRFTKTRLVRKTRNRTVTRGGYEDKVRSWASLFMSRERFEKSYLKETVQVTEAYDEEETFDEEIPVSVPGTRLVELYEIDRSAGDSSEIGFSIGKRVSLGSGEGALLTIRPVAYDAGTLRLSHLRRLKLRIDYVVDRGVEADRTRAWREIYDEVNAERPEWLDAGESARITIRKPAYSSRGSLDDPGLYRLTMAELQACGLDVTGLAANPERLRLFQGDVELSLLEEGTSWVFFADSGLLETLVNDRVVLQAIVDDEVPGRRWTDVASRPGFDRELTRFEQLVRHERNGTFSPMYFEGTPSSVFVHPSSVYKTQTRSYGFLTPGIDGAGSAVIRAHLYGTYDFEPSHDQGAYLKIAGNGPFATGSWAGRSFTVLGGQVPAGQLGPGTNQFQIQGFLPAGIPKSRIRLDWFDVRYPRQMIADAGQLLVVEALESGVTRMSVDGLADPSTAWVVDVTDAGHVRRITGGAVAGTELVVNVEPSAIDDSVRYPNFLRLDSDFGALDPNGRGNVGFGFQTGRPGVSGVAVDSESAFPDRTDPDAKLWKIGDRVAAPAGDWADRYRVTGPGPMTGGLVHRGNRILFLDASRIRPVESVTRVVNGGTPVRGRRSAVDHLIIVDETLMTEAGRLRDHLVDAGVEAAGHPLNPGSPTGAATLGIRPALVEMVSYQQLRREYAHGIDSVAAIDLYLKERFRTAALWDGDTYVGKPRHVTLIGSGNWNTKGIWDFPTEQSLIPSVVVRGGSKASAADWALARIGHDEFPDLSVSRLDCGTTGELADIIDKVVDYDSRVSPATRRALLVADHDPGQIETVFAEGLERTQPAFEGAWSVSKLFRTEMSAAAVSQGILDGINNDDASLLVYSGHGNFTDWGMDRYVTPASLGSLQAGHWLPLVIEVNCMSSDWYHISPRSLGSHWLQKTNGGAIAVIGTTSKTTAADKDDLLVEIVDQVVRRGAASFGQALRKAKVEILAREGGDPSRAVITQHLLGVASQRLK